jgi:hypothetical protein
MAEVIEIDINAKDNTTGATKSATKNFQELGRELGGIGRMMTNIFTRPINDLGQMILKNDEVKKSLQPLTEAWGTIVQLLANSVIPVIKDLIPVLMQLSVPLLKMVMAFDSLTVPQKEAILGLIGLVAAIGPVLMFVSQLIAFVGMLSTGWTTLVGIVTPLVSTVLPAIGAVIAGITLPVWGLIAAIGLLVAAIIIFGKDAWNTVLTIGKIFQALWELIKIKVDQIKQAFMSVDWGAIGRNIMQGIVNGINSGISWIVNAARSAAQAAVDAARRILGLHSPSLVFQSIGQNMMQGMANGINSNAALPISATSKAISGTIPAATNSAPAGGGSMNFVYSPMISLASQAEAENVLLPMLRKLQRSM